MGNELTIKIPREELLRFRDLYYNKTIYLKAQTDAYLDPSLFDRPSLILDTETSPQDIPSSVQARATSEYLQFKRGHRELFLKEVNDKKLLLSRSRSQEADVEYQ